MSYDVIARYYDLEHAGLVADIEMYLEYARAYSSPILVLGAGTGRVVRPLVQAGYELWALDRSSEMLSRAQEALAQYDNVHFARADMTQFELPALFQLVIVPRDTFTHLLSADQQRAALERIHAHLASHGLLLLDLTNPLILPSEEENGVVHERFRGRSGAEMVTIWASSEVDQATQRLTLHLTYDVSSTEGFKREIADLDTRWLYRYELEHLCAASGLVARHIYGDYDLQPYTSTSPRLILTATKTAM
jgi:SAM-dependent methyltransferase